METQVCRTCGDIHPLTKDYWHISKQNKCGYKIHCKKCARVKQREADARYRQKYQAEHPDKHDYKKAIRQLRSSKEYFGHFEAQALADKVEILKTAAISIYQEIRSEPVA